MCLTYTRSLTFVLLLVVHSSQNIHAQEVNNVSVTYLKTDRAFAAVAIRHIGIDVWDLNSQRSILSIVDPAVDGNSLRIMERQKLIVASTRVGHQDYLQFYELGSGNKLERLLIPLGRVARALECDADQTLLIVGLSYRDSGLLIDVQDNPNVSQSGVDQCIVAVPLNTVDSKRIVPLSQCDAFEFSTKRWLRYCNLDQVYGISIKEVETGIRIAVAGRRQAEDRVQWGQRLKGRDQLFFCDEKLVSACKLCLTNNSQTIVVGGSANCPGAEVPSFSWDVDSKIKYGAGDLKFISHSDSVAPCHSKVVRPIFSSMITALSAGPGENQCITGSLDGAISVWDCSSGKRLREKSLSNQPICSISVMGDVIVVATTSRELSFVSVDSF